MKLKAQLAAVLNPLVIPRILKGVISAGYNQVIPNQPTAKKELKTKRNTAAAIPAPELSLFAGSAAQLVPVNIAIVNACPNAPKIINFLLPKCSIVKKANHEAMKYSVPLQAAKILEFKGLIPIYCWKIVPA